MLVLLLAIAWSAAHLIRWVQKDRYAAHAPKNFFDATADTAQADVSATSSCFGPAGTIGTAGTDECTETAASTAGGTSGATSGTGNTNGTSATESTAC